MFKKIENEIVALKKQWNKAAPTRHFIIDDLLPEFIRECLFSFQHESILASIEKIIGIQSLHADKSLYASGVSLMGKNDYLNPHLDNSHDRISNKYRCLNLLYYVSENWNQENGGIWSYGTRE